MMDRPRLDDLLLLFDDADTFPSVEVLAANEVPPPYRQLLVHPHHMTVTIEDFYHGPVSVRVLQRRHTDDDYARKIVLEHPTAGVVLFGIVRIHLRYCSPPVRDAILEETAPLGRILIEHDVLRRIEPTAYLRLAPHPPWMSLFALSEPRPTYGRLGIIHCDDQPAIELLEILAPIPK